MPIDYSKWDNINVDSGSDDEKPKPTGKLDDKQDSTFKDTVHNVPLDHAPPLTHPLSEAATEFYSTTMTAPQRMYTLVRFWNVTASNEDRVVYLRYLIELLGDPSQSNKIKGGQEVLRDLPEELYEGVTVPPWAEPFIALDVDKRKEILGSLFNSLSESERGMVIGSLV